MKLKKIRKIRTIKSIKTNILDFYVDEVKWPNNKKLKRALIRHRGVSVIVPILNKKAISIYGKFLQARLKKMNHL